LIDLDELSGAMRQFGKSYTPDEMERLMESLDQNGDGVISFKEFVIGIGPWFLKNQQNMNARREEDVRLPFF
jgi:Ca2+-binding EF-hand superfamily protein